MSGAEEHPLPTVPAGGGFFRTRQYLTVRPFWLEK